MIFLKPKNCYTLPSDIIRYDQELTVAINQADAPWADVSMHTVSGTFVWVPLYLLLVGLIIYNYRKSSWIILLMLVLLVALSDYTSVHFFKNMFMRLRPSREPALVGLVRLPYGRGGLYGFISSHASNCFAIATFVTLSLRNRYRIFRYGIMFVWAALICYSRVYLARHYVGDVLCGALWGAFLAWMMWRITRSTLSKAYPSVPLSLYWPRKK